MKSYQLHQTVSLGQSLIHLLLHQDGHLIEYEGEHFNHFGILAEKIPLLSDPLYIFEFAQISNFCWKGTSFDLIVSICNYQDFYEKQVALERKFPSDVFPYRLTDYKIFDLSGMHSPIVDGDRLIYFVYNVATGIPYRVVCPFPYTTSSSFVHYQILPSVN